MHSLARTLVTLSERYTDNALLHYPEGDEIVAQTYREFLGEVIRWGAHLTQMGVVPGDRVAIITPKSPNQMRAFYACWWIGAIAVPVCEVLGDLEMGFIIRDSEPKVVLFDEAVGNAVRANSGNVPVVEFSDLASEATDATDVPVDVADDDTAALIYTSGSTGMPKGVMLTHRNFSINAHSALEAVDVTEADRVISLLPYWHSFALVVEVIMVPLAGGCTIIPRDKRDFRRNIRNYQPTVVLLVPRIADALRTGIEKRLLEASPRARRLFAKALHNASRIFTSGPRIDGGLLRMAAHHLFYDPLLFRRVRRNFGGKIRFFVSGGAPLDLEHQIFFKYLGLPIFQGYGLTESTPVISVNRPERHRLGSSGPMLSWLHEENGGDWTFRSDEDGTGRDVKGELLVKGACVMKGYWRHTDASAKTLADGWLHTGDMGYVDDDGFLFLDGRQGNMIVLAGGEKLHPEHVEDAVKRAGLVTETMVFGEGCKNVYACVNVDPERSEGVAPEELQKMVRQQVAEQTEHLASYQKPRDVLVLPEFSPDDGTLTVTLKVRRHRIWELHRDDLLAFLRSNGEDVAQRGDSDLGGASRIMESLGRS